jgi:predicted LPLAT superfamily acyltransferase
MSTDPDGPQRAGSAPDRALNWQTQPDRGTPEAIQLILWITRKIGYRAGRFFLPPIVLYFLLTSRHATRSSRNFLRHARGRHRIMTWEVYRHLWTYAATLHDRIFLTQGTDPRYHIATEGLALLKKALAEGHGVLLLGSHLGSFEVMRSLGESARLPLKIVMHPAEGRPVTSFLESFGNPDPRSVIWTDNPYAMLTMQAHLRSGGLLALLADRAPRSSRTWKAAFLGQEAGFPLTPFYLAARLSPSIFTFYCIHERARHYRIRIEPLPSSLLPTLEETALQIGQEYVQRLERDAHQYPMNWFNFYDFWLPPGSS